MSLSTTDTAAPAPTGPQPRPGVLDIDAYVGGDAHAEGAVELARLASNEGALGPNPKAMAAFQALASDLHRYPDGGALALRDAIGRVHGLDPERIVCGAGSDELIALLVKAYAGQGDEVLYSQYGFLMYPIAAQSVGATPVRADETDLRTDVDKLLAAVTPATRLVFVANPNNPTGSYIGAAEMARLHAGLPADVLLVIDAAYAEYVSRNDYTTGRELVDKADNVVVLHTFSKIHALGALRLGWGYCPPAVADVLNRVRSPFNVSAAAQAAGIATIEDEAFLARSLSHNETWRGWLAQELTQLGLTVAPSVTNFLLVRFPAAPGRNADAAADHLKRQGILIRKMGGYGLPDSLRITIGTEKEMRRVAAALKQFLG